MGYLFITNRFKTILKKTVSIKMNSHICFPNFPPFSIEGFCKNLAATNVVSPSYLCEEERNYSPVF